jgi:DNA-directed RNA polymerase subunit RPC12/RpoP
MENYIQVGQTALRSPSGEFLPAVPLFIRGEDAGGKSEISGLTVAEELLSISVSKVFADKFKQYVEVSNCAGMDCRYIFTKKFLKEYKGNTCPECGHEIDANLKPKKQGRPKKIIGGA